MRSAARFARLWVWPKVALAIGPAVARPGKFTEALGEAGENDDRTLAVRRLASCSSPDLAVAV
jgi:hypothetical protein